MNKKDLDNIKIPTNIDDVIKNAVNKAEQEKKSKKHTPKQKFKRIIPKTAAGFAIFLSLGIGTTAVASNLPAIKDAFQRIQNQIHASGDYSKYATSINESVTSNGVSVTLSQTLCDGENLYVSYIVKSQEPFKYIFIGEKDDDTAKTSSNSVKRKQLLKTSKSKVSFSDKELDDTGIAGLEGEFLDDHTFIGLEEYTLFKLESSIPDEFDFTISFEKFRNKALTSTDEDKVFKGSWNFKVPVKVDKSLTKVVKVNASNKDGLGIKQIKITPFKIFIETTSPTNNTNFAYNVRAKDENGNYLNIDSHTYYDTNKVITFTKEDKMPKKITVELFTQQLDPTQNFKVIGEEILYKTEVDLTK